MGTADLRAEKRTLFGVLGGKLHQPAAVPTVAMDSLLSDAASSHPFHQARALEEARDYPGAAMAYSDARFSSTHVPASLGLLRVQVRNLGDFEGAVLVADELIQRGIESFDLYMHTGFALGAMGHDEAAAGAFERAAEIDSSSGLTFYNLACCRARAGQEEAALDALRRAVFLDRAWAVAAFEDDDFEELSAHPRFGEVAG